MASGRLRLQLLGFFLDLLGIFLYPLAVVPHPQDFALDLLRSLFAPLDRDPIFVHPLLVLHHALLVAGILTPVERRAQVARRIARTQKKLSPPRQR
jgi:hypothetical protein